MFRDSLGGRGIELIAELGAKADIVPYSCSEAGTMALSRPDLYDRFVCCCGRPKAEFIDDLAAAKDVKVLIQYGRDDESVAPDLIAKGVGPLREAGLDVTEHVYDTTHRIIPEMAVAAAEFGLG